MNDGSCASKSSRNGSSGGMSPSSVDTSTVAVVKPQVSFFERFGSAGYAALEEVMAAARAAR